MSIGIDVGGTNIKWCVLDSSFTVVTSGSLPTPRTGEESVVDVLENVVCSAQEHFHVQHIGVALPGHVNRVEQTTRLVPNIPGSWTDFAIGREIETRVGVRVELLNDARAFAMAELQVGRAQGMSEVVFATIGTGVGGALAVGGTILRNEFDSCGELGHMTYQAGGRRCGCGAYGCVEAYAGGNAIVERAHDLGYGTDDLSPLDVVNRAHDDEGLFRIVTVAADALARAVTNVCVLVDARAVVLGGGVGTEVSLFAETTKDRLSERAPLLGTVPVFVSQLGTLAGAIGAAVAAFHESPHSKQGRTSS